MKWTDHNLPTSKIIKYFTNGRVYTTPQKKYVMHMLENMLWKDTKQLQNTNTEEEDT